ncbi:transcriptional regulator [Cellulosimicrobium cellulans]|uniref:transcriptional regulator n=1 Tax=Cellulosimicrobium cellulans TaxID=1710 RepID=UPI00130E918F|nr:transcriptional regulator [Cellulosimicrobium cellulans]
MTDQHPLARLDETVHQRVRLGILAVLAERTDADFTYLRRVLGLTDGNLGRHLEVLVTSGLVDLRRGYDGRRSRTWARITDAGRRSLVAEVDLLRSIAALVEPHNQDYDGND